MKPIIFCVCDVNATVERGDAERSLNYIEYTWPCTLIFSARPLHSFFFHFILCCFRDCGGSRWYHYACGFMLLFCCFRWLQQQEESITCSFFMCMFLKGMSLTPSASKWINKKSFVLLFVFIFSSDGYTHSTHSETHGIWSCAARLNYSLTLLDTDFVSLIDARDKRIHTPYDLSAQQEQIKFGWVSFLTNGKQRPSTYADLCIKCIKCKIVLRITHPYSSAAPAIPPPQWPIMYMAARSGEMAPITAMPNVTAGFICAPCCHRSYE